MPSISYGVGAYRRDEGDFPPLELVNMFVEKSPTSEGGIALVSRRGLTTPFSLGSGPIYGIFTQSGTVADVLFAVSGSNVYVNGIDVGAIDGTVGNPVSWAGTFSEVLLTRGGSLYSYIGGGAMVAVTFPDTADVTAVTYHDGLFLAIKADTHQVYFSDVNDGRTFDALNFFSAESKPDPLLDLKVLNDTLYLFGGETIEPWVNTGDAELPYQRIEQRIYHKGLMGTGCVRELDNTLYFVGRDGIVYRLGGDGPERVSNDGIEERIKSGGPEDITTYTFVHGGHAFFAVRVDGSENTTHAFDVSTGEWCELQKAGNGQFRPRCATYNSTTNSTYFGDDTDGTVWRFGGLSTYADGGSSQYPREFTAALPLDAPGSIDNLRLWTSVGDNSTIGMEYSRDAGLSWTAADAVNQPNTLSPRVLVEWRRLGLFDFPGAMFRFSVSSTSDFRLSAVKVNEPGGGRSR